MTSNIAPLILAVDDDKDYLEIIEARLNAQGYKTATAADGDEAVAKAKELHPSLILMDVEMPNKDGVAATLALSANPATQNIPVIFLTNLGDANMTDLNRKFAKEIGARDYFKKSDDYTILMSRIHKLEFGS